MLSWLPHINAGLNGLSALFLLLGFRMIRRRMIRAHRACMLTALSCSLLFLVSYLVYHAQVGTVRFSGGGWVRTVYLAVLASHSLLAAVVLPMALVTVTLGLRDRRDRHRRLARVTLPLWLYVSVTGLVVYFMLYHW